VEVFSAGMSQGWTMKRVGIVDVEGRNQEVFQDGGFKGVQIVWRNETFRMGLRGPSFQIVVSDTAVIQTCRSIIYAYCVSF
jgi:hypothetical protein